MRNRHASWIALITLFLFAGLLAVPVILTWRQVRQERLNHALIASVDRHDTSEVRALLREGANPNTPIVPEDKRSAWTRMLDRLLDRSAPTPYETDSILLKAVAWRAERDRFSLEPPRVDNTDIARMLVENGAIVNFNGTGYEYQSSMSDLGTYDAGLGADARWHTTPLLAAASLQQWNTVKLLLAHHGDVNASDTFGNTALMYAAGFDNAEVLDLLLNAGADVNAINHSGETALMFALDAYRIMFDLRPPSELRATVACLLQHGASVNIHDSTGTTVLQMAFYQGNGDRLLLRMLKHAATAKAPARVKR